MEHTIPMRVRGFTLIELLVVIAIIGLLATVILASVNNARSKGAYAAAKQLDANFHHNLGDSLVGQWLFDECSGTVAKDTSGFGNNGSISSSFWSTDTPFGSGCSFSDTNSSVSATVPQLPVNGMTVTAWAKITDHHNWQNIVNHNWSTTGGWLLYTGASSNGGGAPIFGLYQGTQYNAMGSTAIPLNVWVFLVGVYDGRSVIIYMNGAQAASVALSSAVSTNGSVIIGGGIHGNIDNVRIYERALDTSEVRSLYLAEAPRHGVAFAGQFGVPF